MQWLFSIAILSLITTVVEAQGLVRIRGVVSDSAHVPISGVRVELVGAGRRTVTGEDGVYVLERVPAGEAQLRFTRLGFLPLVQSALLVGGDSTAATLRTQLTRAPLPLSAVVVSPGFFGLMTQTTPSMQSIGREQLMTRPQLGEDLFRSINRLPGVTSGDFSAGFHVRGAEVDQTLVTLDGMELYEPFHMKDFDNAISILDVQSIGGVELTTSGFTADHGGRLGSVLALKSTDPKTDRVRTAVGVSVTNLRAQTQGGFDNGRGSWLVSARRGYLDLALKLAGRADSLNPTYSDVFAKTQYELSAHHTLSAQLLLSGDKTQYAIKDGSIASSYGSNYGWLTWDGQFGNNLVARTVLSSGKLTWQRQGDEQGAAPVRSKVHDIREFNFMGVRSDWTLSLGDRWAWRWGAEVKPQKGTYDYAAQRSIRRVQADTLVDDIVPYLTTMQANGTQASAYLAPRFKPFSWLVTEIGARYDQASWTKDALVSPRANALITITPELSVRLATGRYVQPQQIFGLQVQDGVSTFAAADMAEHRVLGVEYHPWSNTTLRAEGYERITTQERPRYVNLRSDVIVFPELNLDRTYRNATEGVARGVELSAQVSSATGWDVSASYAQSYVADKVSGVMVPRTFDQQHTAYVDVSYKPVGSGWRFSAAWQLHSGWPESPVTVIVDTVRVGKTARQTVILTQYGPITALGASRLPWYHRVDLRATREVETSRGKFAFFVDLFNLFDTENAAAYIYRASVRNNVLSFTHTVAPQLGRLPSAGVSWEF